MFQSKLKILCSVVLIKAKCITMITNFGWEESFIIKLILDPGHQVVNVFRRRAFDWLFDVGAIGPVILVSIKEAGQRTHTQAII